MVERKWAWFSMQWYGGCIKWGKNWIAEEVKPNRANELRVKWFCGLCVWG